MTDPALAQCGFFREHDLDCGAALSSCRIQDLFDQPVGDFLGVVALGDNQHVNRAYEPSDLDRWPQAENRTAYNLTTRLYYHDARSR